jgi:hypothetical protein
MGDAKSRQRMKDGSHGKGRVNIEIAPVLGSDAKSEEVNYIFITFLISSQQPFLPKITFHTGKHMYWQLVAMFVNTGAIRTNPATVTTLTERGLQRQNDTNLESPVPATMWPLKLP